MSITSLEKNTPKCVLVNFDWIFILFYFTLLKWVERRIVEQTFLLIGWNADPLKSYFTFLVWSCRVWIHFLGVIMLDMKSVPWWAYIGYEFTSLVWLCPIWFHFLCAIMLDMNYDWGPNASSDTFPCFKFTRFKTNGFMQ